MADRGAGDKPVAIDAKIEPRRQTAGGLPHDNARVRQCIHLDAHVGVGGTPAEWRTGNAEISCSLSYDALNPPARRAGRPMTSRFRGARARHRRQGDSGQGLDASIKGNGIDLSAAGN
jgi:hypothetical protein